MQCSYLTCTSCNILKASSISSTTAFFTNLTRYFPKRVKGSSEAVRLYPRQNHPQHRDRPPQRPLPTRLPAIKFDHPTVRGEADIGRAPVLPPSHTRYDVDVQGYIGPVNSFKSTMIPILNPHCLILQTLPSCFLGIRSTFLPISIIRTCFNGSCGS